MDRFHLILQSVTVMASLPARGAWVETAATLRRLARGTSLPARGAWVETRSGWVRDRPLYVAPRAGGVG